MESRNDALAFPMLDPEKAELFFSVSRAGLFEKAMERAEKHAKKSE